MRIKQVTVKGLFGSFDHTIPLNMENRITILHGLNGVGKTTILSMIDAFFDQKFDNLCHVDFEEFLIEFDFDEFVVIKSANSSISSSQDNKDGNWYYLKFHNKNGESYKHSFFCPKKTTDLNSYDNNRPRIISVNQGSSQQIQINYNNVNVSNSFHDAKGIIIGGDIEGDVIGQEENSSRWLLDIIKSVDVQFIQYQRLLSDGDEVDLESNLYLGNTRRKNAVEVYSENLAKDIKRKFTDYGSLSNKLDRSFPTRVLAINSSIEISQESLRDKIQHLEERRERLVANGLLKSEEEVQVPLRFNESMDNGTQKVLSVYIEDAEEKLNVFNEVNKKINLFKEIVDQKLLRKKVTVDSEKGLVFHTDTGHELAPTDLSSGEQHIIVMLYELLFNLKPNSLVLLDEPEISLHMAWKVRFLKDLVRIVELSEIDVVLATHSASLIKDRWDLTVELKV